MGLKKNDSCLKKVADDEPIFVLRAQDRFAPMLVRLWADLTKSQRGTEHDDKVTGAYELANKMDEWARENPTKFPD